MPDARWPKFTWDARLNRYRDDRGRMVPRTAVRQALDEAIEGAKVKLRADALALQAGAINVVEWTLRTEAGIKTIHTMATAVAAGGWAQVTAKDWAIAGSRIKAQYGWLDKFARGIEAGTISVDDGRFVARAQMYANAGSGTYEKVLRWIDARSGRVLMERRILHSGNPCHACSGYAALGWQEPGTLPNIGEDCQCLSNCQCSFERKFAPAKAKATPRPRPSIDHPIPPQRPAVAAQPARP